MIAVDPTSPFTGGAILGDRVRMQDHDTDDDVFVRSMATRGELGGLSRAVPHAVRVLDAAGYSWILVETVGVGQVEVAVAGAADTTVVVVTPGWGDSIQASKAGLLEIGDVFVVNKADRGGVDATVNDLRGMLAIGDSVAEPGQQRAVGHRPSCRPSPSTVVGSTSCSTRSPRHRRHLEESGGLALRRELRVRDELRGIVLEWVAKRADAICSGPRFDSVAARVAAGVVDPYTAATELVGDQT